MAAVILWMGVYPESFLRPIRGDVGLLLARVEAQAPPSDARLAVAARGAPSLVARTEAH
jgi:NADH-quinone oxidoreductase subunit M